MEHLVGRFWYRSVNLRHRMGPVLCRKSLWLLCACAVVGMGHNNSVLAQKAPLMDPVHAYVQIVDVIQKYCQYWKLKEYHQMFLLLSPEAQHHHRVLDFMSTYEEFDRQGLDFIRNTILMMGDRRERAELLVRIDFLDLDTKHEVAKAFVFHLFLRGDQWVLEKAPHITDFPTTNRGLSKVFQFREQMKE